MLPAEIATLGVIIGPPALPPRRREGSYVLETAVYLYGGRSVDYFRFLFMGVPLTRLSLLLLTISYFGACSGPRQQRNTLHGCVQCVLQAERSGETLFEGSHAHSRFMIR